MRLFLLSLLLVVMVAMVALATYVGVFLVWQ